MKAFSTFTSRVTVVPAENIDTDQIIPARFLKTTEKAGLGRSLFSDWRYKADGSEKPDFPLNQPEAAGTQVLFAGDNFGCGSSREHAPWALTDFGFRAIISTSFADIFRNNALKNGLLPVAIDPDAHQKLADQLTADPGATVTVDLENQRVVLPDGSTAAFPIDAFARTCLLQGVDELGYVLAHATAIDAYEATHPGRVNTLGA